MCEPGRGLSPEPRLWHSDRATLHRRQLGTLEQNRPRRKTQELSEVQALQVADMTCHNVALSPFPASLPPPFDWL